MVALCGEFPADQLTRLIPSPSYGEKLITELKAQKLLRTHYRDHLRGYRLTGRAKQMHLVIFHHHFALLKIRSVSVTSSPGIPKPIRSEAK